ncbi:hypothetical protein EYZ11_009137 [Aspergillus tanneri]|uniref:Uncharacterized protein n=1 Tax=Aspergillus tanneri TaxID=1220188 RepID=A0A4S3JAU8_9EURO|nr:hypothetical protein EYZ11_009137 [Aspergillus tanneri]
MREIEQEMESAKSPVTQLGYDHEQCEKERRDQGYVGTEMVKTISDAFIDSLLRIGCAGQVSLDKMDDEPGPDEQSSGSHFNQ